MNVLRLDSAQNVTIVDASALADLTGSGDALLEPNSAAL
jgi:hypothetical protein